MEGFAERFLATRDRSLSPHESWRGKAYEELEVSFLRPLEYLGPEDWKAILLAGAENNTRRLLCRYRYTLPRNEVMKLNIRYTEQYLLPLFRRRAIGGPFSGIGLFGFSLFSKEDTPPEDRRFISREELEERLEPYGAREVPLPRIRDN